LAGWAAAPKASAVPPQDLFQRKLLKLGLRAEKEPSLLRNSPVICFLP